MKLQHMQYLTVGIHLFNVFEHLILPFVLELSISSELRIFVILLFTGLADSKKKFDGVIKKEYVIGNEFFFSRPIGKS